ncbi:right-handed parallel beta-helix repeat-containing protein [Roseibacillus persicicus]|uniref:right-handed parallel beta-helix repeat-containing protein n=1 Tax=Roseibacillus persicicus TaxID=454148 RepID=UPI0028102862|nr:right-handed parallel beta-helix repeat-containing protein [Roseibacillus persicicus]MDQ8192135.1 right-handed parallel beta-helix repeat-containing protein [Roseibacillus persicicus]
MKLQIFSLRLFLVLSLFSSLHAQVVTNRDDSGPGSLRDTITSAAAGATITFDPSLSGQEIYLNSQYLLDKDLIIDASSLRQGIILDGSNTNRIIEVTGNRSITCRRITFQNGTGTSTMAGNTRGGAIAIRDSGDLVLEDCQFTSCQTSTGGGAIFNQSADLTLRRCFFGYNQASVDGGAINCNGGLTYITNCTFLQNIAGGSGGAIKYSGSSDFSLTSCTLVTNSAEVAGGGLIYLGSSQGNLTLQNSILTNNDAPIGADLRNDGSTSTIGSNLLSNISDSGLLNGSVSITTEPSLAPEDYYGGPTLTMPPLMDSPARDAGGETDPGGTDQRGSPRFSNGALDIGAVEIGSLVVNTTDDNTTDDENHGSTENVSLREAIAFALPESVITFDTSVFNGSQGSILLTEELTIGNGLTINASAITNKVTIDANATEFERRRVLTIEAESSVELRNLILTGGWTEDGADGDDSSSGDMNSGEGGHDGGDGGGILLNSFSELTLSSTSVANNQTGNGGNGGSGGDGGYGGHGGHGGGILVRPNSTLVLNSSSVKENKTGNGGHGGDGGSNGNYNRGGRGGNSGAGGGIFVDTYSQLTLDSSCVSSNQTGHKGNGGNGGDYGEGGSSGRSNKDGGGGIYMSPHSELTLDSSAITNNRTGNGGDGGDANMDSDRFGGAGSNGGPGGGIYASTQTILTLDSSQITRNHTGEGGMGGSGGDEGEDGNSGVGGDGGGIRSSSEGLTLSLCTLSENQTGRGGRGGGFFCSNSQLNASHCTIATNIALGEGEGGGIASENSEITLQNSILAGNSASSGPDLREFNTSNTLTVTGNNIFSSLSGQSSFTPDNPNLFIGNPLLAPLGDYGGPTHTMIPLPGSLAINAANSSTATLDQRGFAINDGQPDIGATEVRADDFTFQEPVLEALWNTDHDHDGSPFGLEIALGTDPDKPDANAPQNLSLTFNGIGQPVLEFAYSLGALPFTNYLILHSSDLGLADPWETVYASENPDDGGTTNFGVEILAGEGTILTDTTTNSPKNFYRIQADFIPLPD